MFFYKYLVSNDQSAIVIDKLSEKFTISTYFSKKERKKGYFFVIKGYSIKDEALDNGNGDHLEGGRQKLVKGGGAKKFTRFMTLLGFYLFMI